MVKVIKSEWHQVEKQYFVEIDEAFLSIIYFDATEEEIAEKMAALQSGEMTIDELEADAEDVWYDLDWEYLDEDWWTERKGGYEVTYEIEDADN